LADIGVPSEAGQPDGQEAAIQQDAALLKDTGPYTAASVDEAAAYPGGFKAMMRFLQMHLRHPADGYDMPRKIRIQFVVAQDGTVGEFKVIQSGGERIDLEVIKVLQKMPRWKPAKKNGSNVAMYFVQPVSFETLEE
jgi:protein TonB